ncbi:MAG: insulinase family protein [Cytophagales bacterium]|nr:insulinase family protein [Armatimonadota bacterium]
MFDPTLRRIEAAFALLITALAALSIPLPRLCCAAPDLPSSPVQRRTLPSGLRVIVAEQPGAALLALDLRVRAGSGSETPETNGTAHFIEHLLFKGTERRGPGEIDRAMETLGGELTAQTTRDATRYATVLPSAGWRDALAILADMTLHPAFRAADVAAEKRVIRSEMAIARTEPTRAGFGALSEIAFGPDNPYRLPLMGSETNVDTMTPGALRLFWQQWYRPANMTLVVAGDVRAAEVFAAAEQLWGASDSPAPPETHGGTAGGAALPSSPPRGRRRAATRHADERVGLLVGGGLVTVLVGFPAPSAGNADAFAATAGVVSLLAEGANRGGGGRLTDALVGRQKLALSVTADMVAQRGESLVVVTATGRRAEAAKLEAALRTTLKRLLAGGFTSQDADMARQNLLAAHFSDDTLEGTAARLALTDVLGLSASGTDDRRLYAARLERTVTWDSMTKAAQRSLTDENAVVVVIGADAP